jgi:hypothetical protein
MVNILLRQIYVEDCLFQMDQTGVMQSLTILKIMLYFIHDLV